VTTTDWSNVLTGFLALFALASAVLAVVAMKKADQAAREQTRATQGLGVTATRQLAASMAPIVADVRQDLVDAPGTDRLQWVMVGQDGSTHCITLPCRNVGPGPAVIVAAAIVPTDYDASSNTKNVVFEDGIPAESSLGVIPSGETVFIKADLPPGDPLTAAITKALGLGFCAMVRYTDVAGEQRRLSTIYVIPLEDDPTRYLETAVRVHECDSSWNLGRPIMEARRVLVVPTADGRLGKLFEDTAVRISETTETVTAIFEKIEAHQVEHNEKLGAAASRVDPRIVKLGRQMREADAMADRRITRVTSSDHG
jgi:hypothetical protein